MSVIEALSSFRLAIFKHCTISWLANKNRPTYMICCASMRRSFVVWVTRAGGTGAQLRQFFVFLTGQIPQSVLQILVSERPCGKGNNYIST